MTKNECTLSEKAVITRRRFLKVSTGLLGLFTGIVLGVPFVGSLVTTRFTKHRKIWNPTGSIDSIPEGQPTRINFPFRTYDAYLTDVKVHSIWAIKHSPSDVTVFSPVCTHLGCYYKWNAADNHFECPCHGSVFSIDGKVLGGPAPRPLDTLPHRIEHGKLFVQWEEFKVGISGKKVVG